MRPPNRRVGACDARLFRRFFARMALGLGLECPDKCSNYADVQQLTHVIEPLIRGLVCDTQTISVLHQIYRKVPFPQT